MVLAIPQALSLPLACGTTPKGTPIHQMKIAHILLLGSLEVFQGGTGPPGMLLDRILNPSTPVLLGSSGIMGLSNIKCGKLVIIVSVSFLSTGRVSVVPHLAYSNCPVHCYPQLQISSTRIYRRSLSPYIFRQNPFPEYVQWKTSCYRLPQGQCEYSLCPSFEVYPEFNMLPVLFRDVPHLFHHRSGLGLALLSKSPRPSPYPGINLGVLLRDTS